MNDKPSTFAHLQDLEAAIRAFETRIRTAIVHATSTEAGLITNLSKDLEILRHMRNMI